MKSFLTIQYSPSTSETNAANVNPIQVPLTSDTVILGRHPNCDVVLDHAAISREHAKIEHTSHGFTIEDLQSRNGTWLNDEPLVSKKFLFDGDLIRICDIEIHFTSSCPEAKRSASNHDNFYGSHSSGYGSQTVIINNDTLQDMNISSQINVQNSMEMRRAVGCSDLVRQVNNLENKLHVMMTFAKNFGKAGNSEELIPQFMTNLLRLFPQADFACLLVPNKKANTLDIRAIQRRNEEDNSPIHVSRTILDTVLQTHSGVLGNNLKNDSLEQNLSNATLHSRSSNNMVMAVPILDISDPKNILAILKLDSNNPTQPFTHDDLDLLISVANQVGLYFENIKYQEVRIQEKMLIQEMSVAHKVQKGFLPVAPPIIDQYDFFDYYRPAKYLGGDYFDYILLPDGRVAIGLGDVSGKGISAALLMTQFSSEVRYSLLMEKTLPKAMERLNRIYAENHWDNRFITFLLAVINPKTHLVQMLNAGHLYPILSKNNGQIEELGKDYNGFPLGIIPEAQYPEFTIELQPGELVSLMSDGLTDAMNAKEEPFGSTGVRRHLCNPDHGNAKQLGNHLIQEIKNFSGTVPQTDDQCLVVFGRRDT